MTTIVEHPYYGRITYDGDKVTVQKPNLAERLTWLMHHQDDMPYKGYHPNSFLRACEVMGVTSGELDVEIKIEGTHDLPEGGVF